MALNIPTSAQAAAKEIDTAKVGKPVVDSNPYMETETVQNTSQFNAAEDILDDSAEVASTEVSTVAQSRAVVAAAPTYVPAEADDGFGDLADEVGFGSFPIIKLDKTTFESTEGHSFPKMDVIIHSTRAKALIKARAGEGDNIPMIYAYLPMGASETNTDYMKLLASDKRYVQDHVNEWRNEGEMDGNSSPVISVYREVLVVVQNTGTDLDGEMAILNVAPASKAKLAGYRETLRQKGRQLRGKPYALSDVLTTVQPGPKIVKGKTSFHPWKFTFAGLLEG